MLIVPPDSAAVPPVTTKLPVVMLPELMLFDPADTSRVPNATFVLGVVFKRAAGQVQSPAEVYGVHRDRG